VVKTNIGRAIYVVYSFFMIPVLTVLISTIYEYFSSQVQEIAKTDESCLKFGIKRLIGRNRKNGSAVTAEVEGASGTQNLGEELLRNELVDEMQSAERQVDKGVEKQLRAAKTVRWEPSVSGDGGLETAEPEGVSQLPNATIKPDEIELVVRKSRGAIE